MTLSEVDRSDDGLDVVPEVESFIGATSLFTARVSLMLLLSEERFSPLVQPAARPIIEIVTASVRMVVNVM